MIAQSMTLQNNIASWAVDRAVSLLSDGPQQFNAVSAWVAADAKNHFHGVSSRIIRRALLKACSRGVLQATWTWRANEAALMPCTVWIQPTEVAT
jgi:hypothetical protein